MTCGSDYCRRNSKGPIETYDPDLVLKSTMHEMPDCCSIGVRSKHSRQAFPEEQEKRKEKKRLRLSTVSLMRSQVLYRAAQERSKTGSACPSSRSFRSEKGFAYQHA